VSIDEIDGFAGQCVGEIFGFDDGLAASQDRIF
jgi:hypothetical protein